MTTSRVFAILGCLLVVGAAIAGFTSVSTDSGVDCGSWIARDYSSAEHEDDVNSLANSMTGLHTADEGSATKQECRDAISSRTPIVAALGVLAIGSLIGSAVTKKQNVSV